jgi:hypothetical protein
MSQDASGILELLRAEIAALRAETKEQVREQFREFRATQLSESRSDTDESDDGVPSPWVGKQRTVRYESEETNGYSLPGSVAGPFERTISNGTLDKASLRCIQRQAPCPGRCAIGKQPNLDDGLAHAHTTTADKAKVVIREFHNFQEGIDWPTRAVVPAWISVHDLLRRLDPSGYAARFPDIEIEPPIDGRDDFNKVVDELYGIEEQLKNSVLLGRHYLSVAAKQTRRRLLELQGFSTTVLDAIKKYPSDSHDELFGTRAREYLQEAHASQQAAAVARPKVQRGGVARRGKFGKLWMPRPEPASASNSSRAAPSTGLGAPATGGQRSMPPLPRAPSTHKRN